eukprot:2416832-Prymnesium_polylepis.1
MAQGRRDGSEWLEMARNVHVTVRVICTCACTCACNLAIDYLVLGVRECYSCRVDLLYYIQERAC